MSSDDILVYLRELALTEAHLEGYDSPICHVVARDAENLFNKHSTARDQADARHAVTVALGRADRHLAKLGKAPPEAPPAPTVPAPAPAPPSLPEPPALPAFVHVDTNPPEPDGAQELVESEVPPGSWRLEDGDNTLRVRVPKTLYARYHDLPGRPTGERLSRPGPGRKTRLPVLLRRCWEAVSVYAEKHQPKLEPPLYVNLARDAHLACCRRMKLRGLEHESLIRERAGQFYLLADWLAGKGESCRRRPEIATRVRRVDGVRTLVDIEREDCTQPQLRVRLPREQARAWRRLPKGPKAAALGYWLRLGELGLSPAEAAEVCYRVVLLHGHRDLAVTSQEWQRYVTEINRMISKYTLAPITAWIERRARAAEKARKKRLRRQLKPAGVEVQESGNKVAEEAVDEGVDQAQEAIEEVI